LAKNIIAKDLRISDQNITILRGSGQTVSIIISTFEEQPQALIYFSDPPYFVARLVLALSAKGSNSRSLDSSSTWFFLDNKRALNIISNECHS